MLYESFILRGSAPKCSRMMPETSGDNAWAAKMISHCSQKSWFFDARWVRRSRRLTTSFEVDFHVWHYSWAGNLLKLLGKISRNSELLIKIFKMSFHTDISLQMPDSRKRETSLALKPYYSLSTYRRVLHESSHLFCAAARLNASKWCWRCPETMPETLK